MTNHRAETLCACAPRPLAPPPSARQAGRAAASASGMACAGLWRALAAPLRWGSTAWRPSFLLPAGGPAWPAPLPLAAPAASAAPAPPWGARGITVDQLHRRGPFRWPRRGGKGPTEGRPQIKGVVLKTMVRKPKKPNSANRKCARVRLSNGKEVVVFIPGEGHNLQEHSVVLIEGGRTQDLPGIKLKVIRGKYDCARVQKKKQA